MDLKKVSPSSEEPDYRQLYLDLLNATQLVIDILAPFQLYFREKYLDDIRDQPNQD